MALLGGSSFSSVLLLVILVNGLGISFRALARILISDLNQLSAERRCFLLCEKVFSLCCPDAGVGKGFWTYLVSLGRALSICWTGLIYSSFWDCRRLEIPLRFQARLTSLSNEVPVLNLLPALFSWYLRRYGGYLFCGSPLGVFGWLSTVWVLFWVFHCR